MSLCRARREELAAFRNRLIEYGLTAGLDIQQMETRLQQLDLEKLYFKAGGQEYEKNINLILNEIIYPKKGKRS